MKSIAVLMTVFNRKQITLRSLENLFQAKVPKGYKIDVYLTNDGCTDGTPEAVKRNFPQVNIINGDGSLFWNRGMYKAWEEASKYNYDYYLWLNDDTFVYQDFIIRLVEAANITNNIACINGPVENSEKTSMTYGGMKKWRKPVRPNGTIQEIDYFQGNIVLIPRSVFEKVGNLDYVYRHSRGDSDYGLSAGKLGIKCYETPDFLGICDWHSSPMKCFNPAIRFSERWRALFKPNGENPCEIYYYWAKHRNIFIAIYFVFYVIMRTVCPQLWYLFAKDTIKGKENSKYIKVK